MRRHRSFLARLSAGIAVTTLLAACSAGASPSSSAAPPSHAPTPLPTPQTLADYPSDFPTSWANDPDPGNPGLIPVAGGLGGTLTGTLRADDGTTATYTSTWTENRVPAPEVTCQRVTYRNLFVGETPEITTRVDFAALGHAELVTVGHLVVYMSSRNASSPAVCDESTGGTFALELTAGPIKQLMSGTWHWDADGRLIFDPPAIASPSQSPA